jgi:hypothetical protein
MSEEEGLSKVGEVTFMTFDKVTGKVSSSVSGRPNDVADFLTIWAQNAKGGIDLARQLGVALGVYDSEREDEG